MSACHLRTYSHTCAHTRTHKQRPQAPVQWKTKVAAHDRNLRSSGKRGGRHRALKLTRSIFREWMPPNDAVIRRQRRRGEGGGRKRSSAADKVPAGEYTVSMARLLLGGQARASLDDADFFSRLRAQLHWLFHYLWPAFEIESDLRWFKVFV